MNLWLSSVLNDFASLIALLMATLYGTLLCLDSLYSAMCSTAFFICPSSSSRWDRYGFISLLRYVVLVATLASSLWKYRMLMSFIFCLARNWYLILVMLFWDNC